jgi:hypothetical protein
VLPVAVTISAILLCVLALQWTLIDWFTLNLVFPLLNVVWVVFAGSAIASVVQLVLSRWRALRPLAVQAAALALAITVPFTNLWIDAQPLRRSIAACCSPRMFHESRQRPVSEARETIGDPLTVSIPRAAARPTAPRRVRRSKDAPA